MSAPSRSDQYSIRLLAVIACVAAVVGAWRFASARTAEREHAEITAKQEALRGEIGVLEKRIAAASTRVAATRRDNAELSAALKKARAIPPASPEPVISRVEAEERIKQVRYLATDGDPAFALKELLWCWDHGVRALARGGRSARQSMLTSAFEKLAERYPPAREELRQRFEALRAKLLAGQDQDDAVSKFALLARASKQPEALVTLYDELGARSPLRRSVGIYAFDQMVRAQRYGDAVKIRDFASMNAAVERLNDSRMAVARSFIIGTMGTNIEVLAGAGEMVQARALAERLLKYEPTAEVRAMVEKHLARAGQGGLLERTTK